MRFLPLHNTPRFVQWFAPMNVFVIVASHQSHAESNDGDESCDVFDEIDDRKTTLPTSDKQEHAIAAVVSPAQPEPKTATAVAVATAAAKAKAKASSLHCPDRYELLLYKYGAASEGRDGINEKLSWNVVGRFDAFDPDEMVLSLSTVHLARKPYLLLGTGFAQTEDAATQGRVLLLDVFMTMGVSHTGAACSFFKIRPVSVHVEKGPVSALASIRGNNSTNIESNSNNNKGNNASNNNNNNSITGSKNNNNSSDNNSSDHIVASVGSRLIVYKWTERTLQLSKRTFYECDFYSVSLCVLKSRLLAVTDVLRGTSLLLWDKQLGSLHLLGRFCSGYTDPTIDAVALSYMVHRSSLHFVVADSAARLLLLRCEILHDSRRQQQRHVVPSGSQHQGLLQPQICTKVVSSFLHASPPPATIFDIQNHEEAGDNNTIIKNKDTSNICGFSSTAFAQSHTATTNATGTTSSDAKKESLLHCFSSPSGSFNTNLRLTACIQANHVITKFAEFRMPSLAPLLCSTCLGSTADGGFCCVTPIDAVANRMVGLRTKTAADRNFARILSPRPLLSDICPAVEFCQGVL